jgi:hypothetical protein
VAEATNRAPPLCVPSTEGLGLTLEGILNTFAVVLFARVPMIPIERTALAEVVDCELAVFKLTLHELAVGKRAAPEDAALELCIDEYSLIEQTPVPVAFLKLAPEEARGNVLTIGGDASEGAVPKEVV